LRQRNYRKLLVGFEITDGDCVNQPSPTVQCLLLAVFASTAAVVHVHPQNGETGPKAIHCLICVAAHSPTILVSAVVPVVLLADIRGIVHLPKSGPYSRLLS
jgi:hypothetical protein